MVDDDLDEVAVISSNAAPENVRYGDGHYHHHHYHLATANGPRVVPGIITAGVDRTKLLTSSSLQSANVIIRKPSNIVTNDNNDTNNDDDHDFKDRCPSQQSLIAVSCGQRQQQDKQSILSTTTTTNATLINGKNSQGKKRSIHQMTTGLINNARNDLEISKKTRELRRKEIKKEFEKWENVTGSMHHKSGCNWSFVFDPSGRLCYYWSLIVSIAFLYNFWSIIYRCAFQEINEKTVASWFALDYFSDFIYILDIAVNFRTGYLEEGVLQTDSVKLRQHYMNCTIFYIDCLCLLPLDILYLSIGFKSILRCFRLIKIYRFWAFLDRTERHTNYPNIFRTLSLLHYILAIFHWNACLSHIIHIKDGFGSRDWFTRSKNKDCEGVTCDYLHAMYWSVLALTTIGDLPTPRTKSEYVFLIMQLVFGLFLFATVLGHVANIVTNVSAARKEFQAKLDAVKTYMRMRRVPDHIQTKVIRWFDYLWMTQKSSDEERSVGCLPDKLKAEIAIHVHLDTLKRVEIFQNTEAGFLCELVLRLRPVLFSPGDYICRKGEVGKEMYIVNRGRLQVVTDNGKTVLATLRAGSYFGEISILNMGTAGNRRTASVRSVGYSDLFCLNKQDMWDVLKDYPAARVRLEAIAVKRLEKYRKEPLKKIAMGRSKSTPGLVESKGKIPVGNMNVLQMKENQSASTATLLKADDDDDIEDGEEKINSDKDKQQQDEYCNTVDESTSSMDTMKQSSSKEDSHPDGGTLIAQQQQQLSCCDIILTNKSQQQQHTPTIAHQQHQTFASPSLILAATNNNHHQPQQQQTQQQQTLIYSSHLLSPNIAFMNFDNRSPQQQQQQHSPSPIQSNNNTLYPSSSSPLQLPHTHQFLQAQHLHPHHLHHQFTPSSSSYCTISPAASTNQLPIFSNSATPILVQQQQQQTPSSINNNNSNNNLCGSDDTNSYNNIQIEFPTQDALLSEIKRLRERLLTLETENASMSMKLNQQQWQVENRLAEIEHQISSAASANSCSAQLGFISSNNSSNASVEDNERNKESII
ncbi:cyclic nucleotide-gated channel rod photoreceptor subunit alpha-like [Dermatophagoides farinae]|nr:cyclic nucleotide-gated channel rod photoreceptor subunit alpha-like [Dermatophagoides farinae]